MTKTIQFIAASAIDTRASTLNVLELANDTNPATQTLQGVDRIHLHFPKFTDGRAYSQAYLLRRRLGFTGDIRATIRTSRHATNTSSPACHTPKPT